MDEVAAWQVGQTIADLYQIRGINTEGGMSIVYFVWHAGWNMELVIKCPRPELLADQSSRDRFVEEAETWVDLGLHPNIVTAYYVRQIDDFPRIIIEKMDGGSLKTWLAEGKVGDLATALDIAIQVASGLAYAHKLRPDFVHRDLKPANVLMTPYGEAKVTDFGLVGAIGEMVGTPAYMAPEMWTDPEHSTAAADLYSFGVLVYELLTGRRPFERGESATSLGQIHGGRGVEASLGALREPDAALQLEPSQASVGDKRDIQRVTDRSLGEVSWPDSLEELSEDDLEFYRAAHTQQAPDLPGRFSPGLPADLSELCGLLLAKAPAQRPESVEVVLGRLREIYREAVGTAYPREEPREAQLLADGLSNRGASLWELDDRQEAVEAWRQASEVDRKHFEATLNRARSQWLLSEATDEACLTQVRHLRAEHGDRWEYWHFVGVMELERGDLAEALKALRTAIELDGEITCHYSAGVALFGLGEYAEACELLAEVLQAQPLLWQARLVWASALMRQHRRREALDLLLETQQLPGGEVYLSEALGLPRFEPEAALSRLLELSVPHFERLHTLPEDLRGRTVRAVGYPLRASFWPDDSMILSNGGNVWSVESGLGLEQMAQEPFFDGRSDFAYVPWLKCWVNSHGLFWSASGGFAGGLSASVCYACQPLPAAPHLLTVEYDPHRLSLWEAQARESRISVVRSTTFGDDELPSSPLAVSDSGSLAACGSETDGILLADLSSQPTVRRLSSEGSITSLDFSPDEALLLAASGDGSVYIWDLTKGKLVRTAQAHEGRVHYVRFSRDGQHWLSGGADYRARIWETRTGRCLRSFVHRDEVDSVSFSHDGSKALTASGQFAPEVMVWDLQGLVRTEGRAVLHTFAPMLAVPRGLREALRTERERQRLIAEAERLEGEGQYRAAYAAVGRARELPGRSRDTELVHLAARIGLAHGSRAGVGHTWQLADIDVTRDSLVHVAFSPAGDRVATAGRDGVWLIEMTEGWPVRSLSNLRGWWHNIAFDGDGQHLVTAGTDGVLRVWSVSSGEMAGQLAVGGENDSITALAFSPDGRYLATALSGVIHLHRYPFRRRLLRGPEVWKQSATLPLRSGLAFSPDGHMLAAAGGDGWGMYRTADGEPICRSPARASHSVAFGADGRAIITAGDSGTLLWSSLEDGWEVTAVLGDYGVSGSTVTDPTTFEVSVCPGTGGFAAMSSASGAVSLFNCRNGEEVQRWNAHSKVANGVAFGPDGTCIASCGADGHVKLWYVDWEWQFAAEPMQR